MATTKTVTLRLDEDLLARIDEARGLVPREAWLRQAAGLMLAWGSEPIIVHGPPKPFTGLNLTGIVGEKAGGGEDGK